MCCSVLVATFPTCSSSVVAMNSCCSDIEISYNIQRLVMQYHQPPMPKSGVALSSETSTVICTSCAITPRNCVESTEANKGGETYGQSGLQVCRDLNDSDVHKPSGLPSA